MNGTSNKGLRITSLMDSLVRLIMEWETGSEVLRGMIEGEENPVIRASLRGLADAYTKRANELRNVLGMKPHDRSSQPAYPLSVLKPLGSLTVIPTGTLEDILAEARDAERERCAQIAAGFGGTGSGATIAEAIRERRE